MSTKNGIFKWNGNEWHRVRPIDHIESGNRSRARRFTFSKVFVSDIPNTQLSVPNGSEYEMVGEGVATYQYRKRARILVTQNGTYALPKESKNEAEKQAYFALSVLDEHGLVAGWKRK